MSTVIEINTSANPAFVTIPEGAGLPDQAGHAGQFLTTDGSTLSWAAVAGGGSLQDAYDGGTSITVNKNDGAIVFEADPEDVANTLEIYNSVGTAIFTAKDVITTAAPIRAADGAAATPSYAFTAENDLGFYRIGSGNLGLANGNLGMDWLFSGQSTYMRFFDPSSGTFVGTIQGSGNGSFLDISVGGVSHVNANGSELGLYGEILYIGSNPDTTDIIIATDPASGSIIATANSAQITVGAQFTVFGKLQMTDGVVQFADGDALAVSAANQGALRYSLSNNAIQYSVNGGAWTSLGGGGMAIGGAITSGTSKSVLFVNASSQLAQDNTNFAFDDTNNRLGIQQNTPAYGITLGGGSAMTGGFNSNVNVNAAIVATNNSQHCGIGFRSFNSHQGVFYSHGTNISLGAATNHTFNIVQNDTARLVITSTEITASLPFKWAAGNEQTTVGAAGGASNVPASPTKYLKVVDSAGTTLVIPAFAAS